jgi:hypothetical protein
MVETAIKKYIVPDRWNESVDKSSEDRQQITEMVDTIKRCMAEARP